MQFHIPKHPIAIIGMACRLPDADDLGEYWELLRTGGSAVRELPADRLDRTLYFEPEKGRRGKTCSTLGGVIRNRPLDLGLFETTSEFEDADPCHQIFCEVVARAFVDAGYDPRQIPRWRTGIYVGHSGGSPLGGELAYGTLAEETADFLHDIPAFAALPNDVRQSVVANLAERLRRNRPRRREGGRPEVGADMAAALAAKTLRLDGPHMSIDAACASSLVAMAVGAMAVEAGEIDMAVVGGASFNKCDSLILFSHAQSCSATGSRPFDAEADGLISSEGYVAVLIKTLDRALADGDRIHGVIRGIGLSCDGRGRSLWAPRREGQAEAIKRAYRRGIDPRDVDFIEAHATSTRIGDATELHALADFFGPLMPDRRVPIGSVKSNIGHTLETAGLASLLKVLLSMQHGQIPATINFQTPNPDVPWDQAPFYVPTELTPWPRHDNRPRRAAVNAFGIGGLNVHVVVEEYAEEFAYLSGKHPARVPQSRQEMSGRLPEIAGEDRQGEAIAIIGRGVVLPDSHDVESFSELIHSGREVLSEAPADRWRSSAGIEPGTICPQHSPTCRGGYVTDYAYDWQKHRVPPLQIRRANPLQFMLLDAASQAIAESGYDQSPFDQSTTGVVIGSTFGSEFGNQLYVGLRLPELRRELRAVLEEQGVRDADIERLLIEYESAFLERRPALLDETGSFTSSTLASRVGKTYDLMGGAMAIDAGTCSSLAALSTACHLLRTGACSMVLCGGAQRAMDLPSFESLALRGRLSNGKDGYVPGEGAALLLLKRLDAALRDGDCVLGIIRGVGMAADVDLRRAIVRAGQQAIGEVRPASADAVSVSGGCGVSRLDEAESAALGSLYGRPLQQVDPLVRQVGHLQAAHGLAALIRHSIIQGNRNNRDHAGSSQPRLTALTTHSVSGLASHVVFESVADRSLASTRKEGGQDPRLQEDFMDRNTNDRAIAPSIAGRRKHDVGIGRDRSVSQDSLSKEGGAGHYSDDAYTLPASRNVSTTNASSQRTRETTETSGSWPRIIRLAGRNVPELRDQICNSHFTRQFTPEDRLRVAIVARDESDISKKLGQLEHSAFAQNGEVLVRDRVLQENGIYFGHAACVAPRIAFLFPGQGSQYPEMLRELVESSSLARRRMDEADGVLTEMGLERFADLAWKAPDRLGSDVWGTQAAMLIADLICLAEVEGLGLSPFCVTGHSFGEFAALVAAGAWSLEQALRATRARVEAMSLVDGCATAMLAVHCPADSLSPRVEQHGGLFISHYNAPDVTVVGGLQDAIRRFAENLAADGITAQEVSVPCAFHTPFLAPAQAVFRRKLEADSFLPPTVPLLSSVTNRFVAEPDEIRDNLVAQLVEPVRFVQLVERLADNDVSIFLELGPRQVLTRLVRRVLRDRPVTCFAIDHPKRTVCEQRLHLRAMLESRGVLETDFVTTEASRPISGGQLDGQRPSAESAENFDATARRRQRRRQMASSDCQPAMDTSLFSATTDRPRHVARPGNGAKRDSANPASLAERRLDPKHLDVEPADPLPSRVDRSDDVTTQTSKTVPEGDPQGVSLDFLERFLVDFVVEHTGYPRDVVSLDADLEADLGIDSIKKAQLFGELRDLIAIEEKQNSTFELQTFQTLRQVLQLVAAGSDHAPTTENGEQTPSVEPPSGRRVTSPQSCECGGDSAPVSDEESSAAFDLNGLESFLIDFVVEHTGYPRSVVSLDADLEADLGIDSIKKAQLLGELRDLTGLEADQGSTSLQTFATLRQVLEIVGDATGHDVIDEPANGRDDEPSGQTRCQQSVPKTPVVYHVDDSAESSERMRHADSYTIRRDDGVCTMPHAKGPHYQRGLQRGRLHGERLRAFLRSQANVLAGANDASDRILPLSCDEFSDEEHDVLRGIAAGAGVHLKNVIAHGERLLQWDQRGDDECMFDGMLRGDCTLTAALRTSPLRIYADDEPSDNWPGHEQEPMSEFLSPTDPTTREAESDRLTHRYVLRTVALPQRPASPSEPVFVGGALIVGNNDVGRALKNRLENAGVDVAVLEPTDDPKGNVDRLQHLWDHTPVPHLFIMTPWDSEAATTFDWSAWQVRRRTGVMTNFRLCQAWLQLVEQHGLLNEASLVGVTSLGGAFGFTSDVIAAEGGALAGLLKAIRIENWVDGYRATPVKVIDSSRQADPETIVDAIWRELAVPCQDIEVTWERGTRRVVRAVPCPLVRSPKRSISHGGTWVCTGGARGITAHVARELGKRYGLKLHLIGMSPLPDIPDSWRLLESEDPKRLKAEVMRQARDVGRNSVAAWQDAEKALEIDRTLRELQGMGIHAVYHSCDVADREKLARVLEQIRKADGPIDGVLHGAGVGRDARFDRKDMRKVEQCIGAKVDGTLALMELTRSDPLQFFVGFGSISGRFGANGHTDYSLSNDMLAKLIGWYRRQRSEVAAVAFHWHAWGDVGMAVKPETRLALEMIDMQFMPAKEGLEHLVAELEAGAPEPEVLITDKRYYRVFNPAETRAFEMYEAPTPLPANPDHCPLLDGDSNVPQVSAPFAIPLDPTKDPFLVQHRVEDRPVLPLAIGIEMLAEAAVRVSGTRGKIRLRDIRALHALKFFDDRPQTVRVRTDFQSNTAIACELVADLRTRDGELVERDRLYFRGTVEPNCCGHVYDGASSAIPADGWEDVMYVPPGSKIYHGPSFQTLTKFQVRDRCGWSRVSAPGLSELAGVRRKVEGWLVPSAVLDACFYTTAVFAWKQVSPGPSLPVSIGSLDVGRLTYPGEACVVKTEFLRREGRLAWFDFILLGNNGDPILEARDYCIAWLGEGRA